MSTRSRRKSSFGRDQRSSSGSVGRRKRTKSQGRTQRKQGQGQGQNDGSVRSFKTKLASKIGNSNDGNTNSSKSIIVLPSNLSNSLETPNPFGKLLTSKKIKSKYPQTLQLSIISMLKACIECCIHQKQQSSGNTTEVAGNVVNENENDKVTATELFGVLSTLLGNEKNLQHQMAIVVLLSFLLNKLSLDILKVGFKDITPKIGKCVPKFANNKIGLMAAIDCINILIQRVVIPLSPHSWSAKLSQKLFQV